MEKLLKIKCKSCGKHHLVQVISDSDNVAISGKIVYSIFKGIERGDIVTLSDDFTAKGFGCTCKESSKMKRLKAKIPKAFKLFSTKINVIWNNKRMNDQNNYGLCDYSKSEITLSTTHGIDKLSEDRIIDTFYHEKVHSILDAMHERELSENEKFVDVFGKLLRQSDETAEY